MGGDLLGGDLARIVAYDANAVVERHRRAIDSSEFLQGEARRRGTAPAGHARYVQAHGGRIGSLGGNARLLGAGRLDPAAAQRTKERCAAQSGGEEQPCFHGWQHRQPPIRAPISTTRGRSRAGSRRWSRSTALASSGGGRRATHTASRARKPSAL